MINKIITHPGTAHSDDFLACCVLMAKYGVPVERRDPTQADLDNSEILVLDVGGQYNPAKLNFDHHHDLNIQCSLVLVLKWLDLHEKFQRAYRWYDNVDFRDRNGVQRLGEKYGLTNEQMAELGSPVHTALINMFEKLSSLNPLPSGCEHAHDERLRTGEYLYEIMINIGRELIDHAERYDAAWERLEKCDTFCISDPRGSDFYESDGKSYHIMINPSDDITATGDFMRERKIAVMCSHDNRGNGWAILRSNDFTEINLAPLANDPRIQFAHKGGFIAKTKERVYVSDLLEILRSVIK